MSGFSPTSSHASGGTQDVTAATATLTNAQVKALPTTAVQLVAAPGSGFALVPICATLRLAWAADYTNIDAGAGINIATGTGVTLAQLGEDVNTAVSGLLASGEDASAIVPGAGDVPASAVVARLRGSSGFLDTDLENLALNINATNTGNFTGGNAANALKVTLLYYVVTF